MARGKGSSRKKRSCQDVGFSKNSHCIIDTVEELDTRSMRWSARPYDILAPVGSHVQDTDFSRGVDVEQAVMGNARAWHAGLRMSRIRARTQHAASLI